MREMFNLTDSALAIGISRAWLYRKFLNRYTPQVIAGQPMLSDKQIEAIKAEIKKNAKKKK